MPSPKAADLRRDGRILVHAIVSNRNGQDGEYKLRGIAVEESRASGSTPAAGRDDQAAGRPG
jgi:hypothetical protein